MTLDQYKDLTGCQQHWYPFVAVLPVYAYVGRVYKESNCVKILSVSKKLCNLINSDLATVVQDSSVYFDKLKCIDLDLLISSVCSAKVGDEFQLKCSCDGTKQGVMLFSEDLTVVNITEKYVEWISCLTDVTQLSVSDAALDIAEEHLGMALCAANIGIWQWSADSNVKANEIAWKLVGEDGLHRYAGLRAFARKIHKEDRNQIFIAVRDLLLGVNDEFRLELRVKVASEFKWFCIDGRIMQTGIGSKSKIITGVLRDLSGSIEYLIGKNKMQDILSDLVKKRTYELETELALCKQAEAQLLDNLRKERELSDMKSVFVNMVSHEFRTPLAVIQMAVDLLAQHYEALSCDERVAHFDIIKSSIKRMTRIMDDVLVLGKVQEDKLQFNPQSTNIVKFCQNILDEVEFLKDNKRVVFATDHTVPASVCIDQSLMYHIVVNLLSNALKYSQEDKNILLKLECGGGNLSIVVRDFGIGIPVGDIKNLYKLFYRGTNISNRKGLGVGMYVVDHCVKLHNGKIEVSSQENVGTAFKVTIPLVC